MPCVEYEAVPSPIRRLALLIPRGNFPGFIKGLDAGISLQDRKNDK